MKIYALGVDGMKRIFGLILIIIAIVVVFISIRIIYNNVEKISLEKQTAVVEKPLDKYTFENLQKRKYQSSDIHFGKLVKDEKAFSSIIFYFDSDGKKVSGLAHVPKRIGKYPVIVMFRGYVDREKYAPGVGTSHAGEVMASQGFITLAPDFLGFGESASPSSFLIEDRFETYTTALNLLASIPSLDTYTSFPSQNIAVDLNHIGIWGHSNGGHIALAVLAISGKSYPTVLWAPVSKPFPYSILYYTDEFEDHGKYLRKLVADFEKDYDAEKYSPPSYFSYINAPLELHQGEEDVAVPLKWSHDLYQSLKKLDKDVKYFTYPVEDHNFTKGSWSKIVTRDISFFKEQFSLYQ